MSNRSLLEFSHDYCPRNDEECLALGRALRSYMRSGDVVELPPGVVRKHWRHHSDPCPVDQGVAARDALIDLASRANAAVSRASR